MSTFCDGNSIANGSRLVLKRTFSAKDNNSNCKQKFYGGPPKPDTPPVSVKFSASGFEQDAFENKARIKN